MFPISSTNKRKHSTCTMKDKLDVLSRLDKGESASKLASEYGVGRATISDWKKNRDKIEHFCETTSTDNLDKRHTSKLSRFEKLDEAVYLWYLQEKQRGFTVTGPLIQEKAITLNTSLNGDPSFTASSGWLGRWKKRHGIKLSCTDKKSEANSVNTSSILISLMDYSPEQVYSCHETILNIKELPKNILASEEELYTACPDVNKVRLSLFACCNVASTHKLPLMVVGKLKKVYAFKNLNVNSLPVYYKQQIQAWMSATLFKEWFKTQFVPAVKAFNKINGLEDRVVLVVPNPSLQPPTGELCCDEIKVVFVPPDVVPFLQSMNQEVLRNIKCGYKRMLLQSLIENKDPSLSLHQKLEAVTLKDIIYWLAEVWESVTEQTIKNSWKYVWPNLNTVEKQDEQTDDTNEVLELLKEIPGCEYTTESDINEWLSPDEGTCQTFSDDDIISLVKVDHDDSQPSEVSEDEIQQDVSHLTAVTAFDVALRYVEQHDDATPNDIMLLRRWHRKAMSAYSESCQVKLKN